MFTFQNYVRGFTSATYKKPNNLILKISVLSKMEVYTYCKFKLQLQLS